MSVMGRYVLRDHHEVSPESIEYEKRHQSFRTEWWKITLAASNIGRNIHSKMAVTWDVWEEQAPAP